MKRLRIGTITISLLFISLGILMLLSIFISLPLTSIILTGWPILLIFVGIEMLVFIWLKRGTEDIKFRYDFLSIFVFALLGFVTIGMYALQESGILTEIKKVTSSKSYHIQSSPLLFSNISEVKKVKINGNAQFLTIQSTDDDEISAYANWEEIYAQTKEEAKKMTEGVVEYKLGQKGILYITINQPDASSYPFLNHHAYGQVTLSIPNHITLELDQVRGEEVKLIVQNLKNNWNIRANARIEVVLLNDNDIKINATTKAGHFAEDEWTTVTKDKKHGEKIIGSGLYAINLYTEYGYIDIE